MDIMLRAFNESVVIVVQPLGGSLERTLDEEENLKNSYRNLRKSPSGDWYRQSKGSAEP
jgi:hypothetical protein